MNKLTMILTAFVALIIAPVATAKIYKCDGPDGPVYSDMQCGPNATDVVLAETSGLVGISDETKAELAAKKADREQARDERQKRDNNRTVINNQYTTISPEPVGRWYGGPYRRPKPDRPHIQPLPQRSPPGTIGKPRK